MAAPSDGALKQALTVFEHLAREAAQFTYAAIPADVVNEAKLRVMDTLGCAIAGYDSPPSLIVQALDRHLGGTPESTICVSGHMTSCASAALVNGVMVRFTEAMDRGLTSRGGVTQHAHPGEVIPSVFAVAESEHSSGPEVIAAIVLGYQLLNRVSEAMGGARAASALGWKPEIRASVVVPLVVGRLLGLSHEQMVNAVGVSGSYAGELGVMDNPVEGRTMARELKFPFAAHKAILSALLAREGFKGPRRVYEGHQGFREVICRGQLDLDRLTQPEADFSIRYTQTKLFPINGRLQGQTEAILALVHQHNIEPERVASVRITTSRHVVDRMANPLTHRYPETKETADHSAYYAAALAVVDRAIHVSLEQFDLNRLGDPMLRHIIDRVEFIPLAGWTDDHAPTEVSISTIDGNTYHRRVEYPKGHVMNPVTETEIEAKFRAMARRNMAERELSLVADAIHRLDEMDDIHELTARMVAR